MRFLLVEDSDELAKAVAMRLALDGHGVDRAATLSEAAEFLETAPYDLILLDISLPDGDGRDFLARERMARRDTPVIMMTASASVSDRISTLDRGADDYITKPFDFAELQARCRAVLRRHAGAADSRRHFAGFTFDALPLHSRWAMRSGNCAPASSACWRSFYRAPARPIQSHI